MHFRLIRSKWFNLRNEIASVLAVIVRPALHGRQFAGPVAVNRLDGGCPLDGGRAPWVLGGHLLSFPDAVEEVYDEKIKMLAGLEVPIESE